MSWWNNVLQFMGWEEVRAKDEKGRFIADDKSTPDVDESKTMVYKSKSAPKAAPKKRGRPKKSTK